MFYHFQKILRVLYNTYLNEINVLKIFATFKKLFDNFHLDRNVEVSKRENDISSTLYEGGFIDIHIYIQSTGFRKIS